MINAAAPTPFVRLFLKINKFRKPARFFFYRPQSKQFGVFLPNDVHTVAASQNSIDIYNPVKADFSRYKNNM